MGTSGQLAEEVLAWDIMRRVASALAAQGIPCLPLKGVLLQQTVYQGARHRPVSDIDVLVPEMDLEAAVGAVRQVGFRRRHAPAEGITALLVHDELPVSLDLHRRLFARGLFRVSTTELFARSSLDHVQFGAAVHIADPLDVYSHLVGHFAKSRMTAERNARHLADFRAVSDRHDLGPKRTARHLERLGLARAARYVLPLVAADGDDFAADVIDRLAPDRVGLWIVGHARRAFERPHPRRPEAVTCMHGLNATLAEGCLSLARHGVDYVTRHVGGEFRRW